MTPVEDGTGVRFEGRGATERSSLRLQQGFITQNAADSSVTVWQSHLICQNFFKTRRRPWFVQPLRIDHSKIFMNYLFEFPVDYLRKKPWLNDKIYDGTMWRWGVLGFMADSWLNNSTDRGERVSVAHLRLSVIPVTLTTALLLVCISWVLLFYVLNWCSCSDLTVTVSRCF